MLSRLLSFIVLLATLPLAHAGEIKVLTYNTWQLRLLGIVDLADDIDARSSQMPQAIAGTGADIVGFQEVWDPNLRANLITQLEKRGYPYHAYQAVNSHDGPGRGVFQNGLLVVSKFPIVPGSVRFRAFSEYTRADEYFVSKGILGMEIEVPSLGRINFFNAHLGAVSYDSERRDYDRQQAEVRLGQAAQAADFIRQTSRHPITIMTLDANANPWSYQSADPSPEYLIFTSNLDFVDTFHVFHAANEAFTFDRRNRYVSGGHFSDLPNEYIDYVLVTRAQANVYPIKSQILFDQPGKNLSDHFGVLTTFGTSE